MDSKNKYDASLTQPAGMNKICVVIVDMDTVSTFSLEGKGIMA